VGIEVHAVNTQRDDAPLHFETPDDWAAWLKQHHASSTGVWLRIAKKGAPAAASISYPEALDLALCFGWIDALSRSDGATHWLKRFTPRAPRSLWSKVNRDKALALVAAGRMQPAGLKEMQRAQADGRWEAAYDPGSTATVPPDLQAAFDVNPLAAAFFTTLNSQNRYAVLFRLQTAKRAETRARRIETFVAMLVRGEKLHP
jgi:uncharacterized protein YdeI (YjbR/CyaY-like superfamily)